MNKVLSKRIPREFKSNLPKYIALLLLIALSMYLVTAIVASSDTIIIRTDEHNATNHVEDGQFTTFLPLTDEQEKDITDKGVTIERMYSLDIKAEDGSTVRVMKNRKIIDLVELVSGEYPTGDNEAVVERRYAEEHSLDVGDKLTVGGTEYTVCGIGASPDYDAPYQNMSDMAVSSKNFGLIFVTDSEYERVSDSSKSAQTFTYGYLLGNDMTDDKLKDLIEDFDFDYTKVTDKYYLETVNEALEKRIEIENGINDLADGADKLHDGLKDLSDGADTLYDGMNDLSAGADKLYDGLKTLSDGTVQLHSGMTAIYDGASALDKGLGELSSGASSLNGAIVGADSAGLAVFMDIDSMRELFKQDDDYYNMVLSDKPLDIDEGRIYSTTTKADVERSSKVFTELMTGMIVTLIGAAAVIFVVVMYLMMSVMIDRSSFGISLLKTFGYSRKDVKKLYLDGNAITIAISAMICLPLSKLVMNRIFPAFVPNIACGINLNFEWYFYPVLFIAVMLIYLLTSTLLVRKLNRITPAEVLKNRE